MIRRRFMCSGFYSRDGFGRRGHVKVLGVNLMILLISTNVFNVGTGNG